MFELKNRGEVFYYTISSFEKTGLVKHGFSTRRGGVSNGCYGSMNLRFNCEDSRENVIENHRIMSEAIGSSCEKIVASKQVHEDNVCYVTEADCGNGITKPNRFQSADALITDRQGVLLVTYFADCVPLFFIDRKKGIIALAHSGWRGTVKRIGQKTIRKMKDDFGSEPCDILAAIGPSIREDCFEVGDDVAKIFIDEFGEKSVVKYGERYHVDMQAAIRMQFAQEGIPEENIDDCGICTCCNSELLFSHRKTNGKRGNMGAFLELKQAE